MQEHNKQTNAQTIPPIEIKQAKHNEQLQTQRFHGLIAPIDVPPSAGKQ